MTMTNLEKRFVNRQQKAERNVGIVRKNLASLDIKKIRDVLEIGCGIGSVSAYLAQTYNMRVTGTDYDPGQVKAAQNIYPSVAQLCYQVEDASKLSFENFSFDLVASQNTFHHIPDWKSAISEVSRVLRPGGYLLWYDLAFPVFIKTLFESVIKKYALYTIEEIRSEFARNQFDTIFYENALHGPIRHHNLVLQKNNRSL